MKVCEILSRSKLNSLPQVLLVEQSPRTAEIFI